LGYYETYVAQEEAAMDDTKARALAYQMVKQEVLAKKLRLDALAKENRILQLRQELDHKAAETARLYVALLLAAIAFIGLWLYRLKHSQMRFRRMARHDGLTGAFNRHHFLETAALVLARLQKAGAPACLVVLDLDHFKRINDTYGHVAGDDVLKSAAQVVRRELRASDVFGRLGGEEFGILMPSCSPTQGLEIAERVRASLAAARIQLDDQIVITVPGSMGLACTDTFGYVLRQLLTRADAALYQAKRGGRNQVVIATAEPAADPIEERSEPKPG
jgi:diguanylate cyclase (GGDEF)-like protein